jgi:hypothetical protein
VPNLKGCTNFEQINEKLNSLFPDIFDSEITTAMTQEEFLDKITALKIPLDESEKRTMREFELAITAGSLSYQPTLIPAELEEKKQGAIMNLMKWRQESIIRFSLKSDILRTFFENSELLHGKWVRKIDENNKNNNTRAFGAPNKAVESLDLSEKHSLFDAYRADYYLTLLHTVKEEKQDKTKKERAWLFNEAIQLGSFEAIGWHCQLRIEALCRKYSIIGRAKFFEKQGDLSVVEKKALTKKLDDEKAEALTQLSKDLGRLSRLYGRVGYMYSAHILYPLVLYFKTQIENKSDIYAEIIQKACYRNIICASLLEDEPHSLQLTNALLKGRDILSLYPLPSSIPINDWNAAIENLRQIINDPLEYFILTRDAEYALRCHERAQERTKPVLLQK